MEPASTIFALSSGLTPSGIAVIRVSGPQAIDALRALTSLSPQPRHATRTMLRDLHGDAIDDALVLWFPGPRSATGEDVAEFHCHGGRAVVAAIIDTLGKLEGLRPAEPGEFTRRAFENGKLDLVAAEALDDLIHSDTDAQRRQALRQMTGLLGDRALDWRQRLIDASALIEAGIDFADEGDVAGDLLEPARASLFELHSEIERVLKTGRSERLRDGLVVAIMGRPNVGKSALLNALAGRDVAIVTPHAGTTRDLLEIQLDLQGYPVTLIDTAGLREASDPVEREGIRRAKGKAATADLILLLEDRRDACEIAVLGEAPVWHVRTKIDLVLEARPIAKHQLSTVTGAGLQELTDALSGFAVAQFPSDGLITRARHRELLLTASAALNDAFQESQPELMAESVRRAVHAMGRLLGRVDVEDVLGAIFSRFCIGK